MEKKLVKKLKAFWLWVRPILITCGIVLTAKSVLADWYHVPTGSMKPTIVEGDRLFVNKLAYGLRVPFSMWRVTTWSAPARGEIIVCYPPGKEECFVKRVIGIPGDRVAMHDNAVFLNGKKLSYELADAGFREVIPAEERPEHVYLEEDLSGERHAVMLTPHVMALRTFPTVTVPPGHYFVMGDNRDNSSDSRSFGFVSESRVLGQAHSVVVSFDRDRHYLPRRDRFFKDLYQEKDAG